MSMFSLAVFWSRSSMLECGIATGGGVSVRPSWVCHMQVMRQN